MSGSAHHVATHLKRTASSSVLDLAIDAWGDVVAQYCDNGSATSTDVFGSTNSMPGRSTEVDAIVGMQMRHTSGGDYLSYDSKGRQTGRCQGDDVAHRPSTGPCANSLEPSTAMRRIDDLREHALGRVVGKMQRLASD